MKKFTVKRFTVKNDCKKDQQIIRDFFGDQCLKHQFISTLLKTKIKALLRGALLMAVLAYMLPAVAFFGPWMQGNSNCALPLYLEALRQGDGRGGRRSRGSPEERALRRKLKERRAKLERRSSLIEEAKQAIAERIGGRTIGPLVADQVYEYLNGADETTFCPVPNKATVKTCKNKILGTQQVPKPNTEDSSASTEGASENDILMAETPGDSGDSTGYECGLTVDCKAWQKWEACAGKTVERLKVLCQQSNTCGCGEIDDFEQTATLTDENGRDAIYTKRCLKQKLPNRSAGDEKKCIGALKALKGFVAEKEHVRRIEENIAEIEDKLQELELERLFSDSDTEAGDRCYDCEFDRIRELKSIVDPEPSGWETLGNVLTMAGGAALGYFGMKHANEMLDRQGFPAQPGMALSMAFPFIQAGLYGGSNLFGGRSSLACAGGWPGMQGGVFGNQFAFSMMQQSMMQWGGGGPMMGGPWGGGGFAMNMGFAFNRGGMWGNIWQRMMPQWGPMWGNIWQRMMPPWGGGGGWMGGIAGGFAFNRGGMWGQQPIWGNIMPPWGGGGGWMGNLAGGWMGGNMMGGFNMNWQWQAQQIQMQQMMMARQQAYMNNMMQKRQAVMRLGGEINRLRTQIQIILNDGGMMGGGPFAGGFGPGMPPPMGALGNVNIGIGGTGGSLDDPNQNRDYRVIRGR